MKLAEKIKQSKTIIKDLFEENKKVFVTCSFGKDSRVIVDLVMSVDPPANFVGIDTGYEFKETLDFADQLVQETGMNFKWIRPTPEEKEDIENSFGDEMIKDGKYKCCAMKKPAIKPVIEAHDSWVTGLRRDEAESRKDTEITEVEEDITKINPIVFWTKDDIWQYIKDRNLSYHPLYDQGYPSLGCQPCTKKSNTSEERFGRFHNTNDTTSECGLHTR